MRLASICRTKEIRGYEIPAIIHNQQYFLTDLQVFADGLLNCWQMVDLPMFKAKLRSGWVVTSIPEGETLSIHEIGSVIVTESDWTHTQKSLLGYVQDVVKALNPRMENLYNCHGRDTEEINGVRYGVPSTDNPRPWKTEQPINPIARGMFGGSLRHFELHNGVFHLVTIQLFKDDVAVVFGAAEPRTLTFAELMKRLQEGKDFRFPDKGDPVVIEGLVKFTCGGWRYGVELSGLVAEFHDLHDRVHGRPGVIRECMAAYESYISKPSRKARESLRQKYEAIPEHLRMYCGDMDTKDIPIRMILYGKEEIEKWNHYQAAKESGEDLPSIEIPDPPSGEEQD